jgi:hypothetical protein
VLNASDTNLDPGFVSVLLVLQQQIIPGAYSLTSGGAVPNEDTRVSTAPFGANSDADLAGWHTTLTSVPDSTGPSTPGPSVPAQTSASTDLTSAPVQPPRASSPAAAVKSSAPIPGGVPAAGHAPVSTFASVPNIVLCTQLQSGIKKQKIFTDGIVCYGNLVISVKPRNFATALSDPNWKNDVGFEFQHFFAIRLGI